MSALLFIRVLPFGNYSCRLLTHPLCKFFLLIVSMKAPFGGCLPFISTFADDSVSSFLSAPIVAEQNHQLLIALLNLDKSLAFHLSLIHCFRWPYDIFQHFLSIIYYTFGQYRIKYADNLTRNCYHRLHFFNGLISLVQ